MHLPGISHHTVTQGAESPTVSDHTGRLNFGTSHVCLEMPDQMSRAGQLCRAQTQCKTSAFRGLASDVQLPLLQFVPVAPCPVAGHHWKESGPVLLAPTLQIFIGISKVPSQPSLLQAEQAQLPQPFLIGQMLQSPHHHHHHLFTILLSVKVNHYLFLKARGETEYTKCPLPKHIYTHTHRHAHCMHTYTCHVCIYTYRII